MTGGHGDSTRSLSPRTYRWVDRTTKLVGVALVAAGLELGGHTTTGLVLAALGVASGLATVVVGTRRASTQTHRNANDARTTSPQDTPDTTDDLPETR